MKVTKKTIAKTVFLLYLATVLYLCFGQFSNMDNVPKQLFGFDSDKVVHFLMFFPFPLLFYLAFGREPRNAWLSIAQTLCILLLGSLIAAGTEIVQDFIPNRASDIADFRADFISLSCSSAIVLLKDLFKTLRHA